jgi:dTDP-4-dehydrorhamnose reductase
MRILLLGAGGMLGRSLARAASPAIDLVSRAREAVDITDAAALEAAVGGVHPDVIVNAAAFTAVDDAERQQALAQRVNATAVGTLGRIARAAGCRVVHFSTDCVFDGAGGAPYAENAACHPVNAYGMSKLAGERALTESGCEALIIRSQWLFGPGGRSFASRMWERARAGLATRVVTDQRGRPTSTIDLANATWRLVELGERGLLHVTNAGEATRFEQAEAIFTHAGRSDLLTPCATGEYPAAATRPPDSRLDTHRAEAILGGPLPDWRLALEQFLAVHGEQA